MELNQNEYADWLKVRKYFSKHDADGDIFLDETEFNTANSDPDSLVVTTEEYDELKIYEQTNARDNNMRVLKYGKQCNGKGLNLGSFA